MRYFNSKQEQNRAGKIAGIVASAGFCAVTFAQDALSQEPTAESDQYVSGQVTSVINVPGYTYVEVDTGNALYWAAAPNVNVQQGAQVSFSTRVPMQGFYSNSLQREFDIIYFVDRFDSREGTTSIDTEAARAHGRPTEADQVSSIGEIPRAPDGHTIADIYARGFELNGETLNVRGRVVRYTANVLDRNWIRIMDSSSENELIVITTKEVSINDVVLAEGRLELNKNLGQGYIIPIALDDAHVVIE